MMNPSGAAHVAAREHDICVRNLFFGLRDRYELSGSTGRLRFRRLKFFTPSRQHCSHSLLARVVCDVTHESAIQALNKVAVRVEIVFDSSGNAFWARIEVQHFYYPFPTPHMIHPLGRIHLCRFDAIDKVCDALITLGDNCEGTVGIT